jgi:hypothetical protein
MPLKGDGIGSLPAGVELELWLWLEEEESE